MTAELGRVGIWNWSFGGDRGQVREAAAELEELGYGALWFPNRPDSLELAAGLLGATRARQVLGPGPVLAPELAEPDPARARAMARDHLSLPARWGLPGFLQQPDYAANLLRLGFNPRRSRRRRQRPAGRRAGGLGQPGGNPRPHRTEPPGRRRPRVHPGRHADTRTPPARSMAGPGRRAPAMKRCGRSGRRVSARGRRWGIEAQGEISRRYGADPSRPGWPPLRHSVVPVPALATRGRLAGKALAAWRGCGETVLMTRCGRTP